MTEAKVSKLREYFTLTTHHTATHPSDQSGEKIFIGKARCQSALRRDSPIRLNDTCRSNVVLGEDDGNATPVRQREQRNIVID